MKSLEGIRRGDNVRVSRCEAWAKRPAPAARLGLAGPSEAALQQNRKRLGQPEHDLLDVLWLRPRGRHGCPREFRPQIPSEIPFCIYLSVGVVRISVLALGLLLDHRFLRINLTDV